MGVSIDVWRRRISGCYGSRGPRINKRRREGAGQGTLLGTLHPLHPLHPGTLLGTKDAGKVCIHKICPLHIYFQFLNWRDFLTDLPIPLLLILSLQQLDVATLSPGNFVVLVFALKVWSVSGPKVGQCALNFFLYLLHSYSGEKACLCLA